MLGLKVTLQAFTSRLAYFNEGKRQNIYFFFKNHQRESSTQAVGNAAFPTLNNKFEKNDIEHK